MIIYDRIYGPVTVTEPVILDLLNTQALRRLDGVLQHGVTALVGVTTLTSRLEHSIGAMLLVRRLGATLDEQIAALLHDISHTAMSHVIDYVYARHDSQSYHDEMKEWYVAQSDIPAVLARYGYDWRSLLHEEDFPLLEQPSPALCADRVDYFLRDGHDLGVLSAAEVASMLQHITVQDGRIVVDDLATARLFAYGYIAADEASWSNFYEVGLYEVTAQALRLALRRNIITNADFWGTDAELWQTLRQSDDPMLQAYLGFVSKEAKFVRDETDPTFYVTTKIRTIDPDVLHNGTLVRFSSLDPAFATYRQNYIAQKQGQWPMRVVDFPAHLRAEIATEAGESMVTEA